MSPATDGRPQAALLLLSTGASGTERRIAFVYRHLCARFPGRYHLLLNRDLFEILQRGGFALDALPNVHLISGRSAVDFKRRAHTNWLVNLGRLRTLAGYRRAASHILRTHGVRSLQAYLEMVPFLGLQPIDGVDMVASLVSHHPKYYSRIHPECLLLLQALKSYRRIDALYPFIQQRLIGLGVPAHKITAPRRNCVNHDRFRPESKQRIVTFSARAIALKNPLLMLRTIQMVVEHDNEVRFYILGGGPLYRRLKQRVRQLGLGDRVTVEYRYDPSTIVNRSLIHLSLERFDNTTNQSLLEGMASGCAVIATDVGSTRSVVTPEVGLLVDRNPDAIADALRRLLDSPDLTRSLGQAARQAVLRDHHVDDYIRYLDRMHGPGGSIP